MPQLQNPFCMAEVSSGNKAMVGGFGSIKLNHFGMWGTEGRVWRSLFIQVVRNSKSFVKRSSHCLMPRPPGCLQEICKVLQDSEMVMKILPLNCVDLAWNVPQGCGPWECNLKSRGCWVYLVAGFGIFIVCQCLLNYNILYVQLNLIFSVLLLFDSSGVIFLDCVYFVRSRWLEFRHLNMLLLQQGKECLFLRRM